MTSAQIENRKVNLINRLAVAASRKRVQKNEAEAATRPTPDLFLLAGDVANLSRRVTAMEKGLDG